MNLVPVGPLELQLMVNLYWGQRSDFGAACKDVAQKMMDGAPSLTRVRVIIGSFRRTIFDYRTPPDEKWQVLLERTGISNKSGFGEQK